MANIKNFPSGWRNCSILNDPLLFCRGANCKQCVILILKFKNVFRPDRKILKKTKKMLDFFYFEDFIIRCSLSQILCETNGLTYFEVQFMTFNNEPLRLYSILFFCTIVLIASELIFFECICVCSCCCCCHSYTWPTLVGG